MNKRYKITRRIFYFWTIAVYNGGCMLNWIQAKSVPF